MTDGKIIAQGNYAELQRSYHELMTASLDSEDSEKTDKVEDVQFETKKITSESVKQENTKEAQNSGSVGFSVYNAYFRSVESTIIVVIVAICLIIEQLTTSSMDYFVSKW